MRRTTTSALVATLVLAGAGCTSTPDDETTARPTVTTTVTRAPQPRPTPIPPVADPPPTNAVAWAQGSRLHVGTQLADLAPLHVDAFAVTRGGVFVISDHRLWLTDLTRARDTGYRRVRALTVSPDGRYLGFVDLPVLARESHAVAVATVYDTTTGEPVVASTVGMGDATKGDLADLYQDAEPEPLGFLPGGSFVARTPDGAVAYPLRHGRPRRLKGDVVPTSTQAGTTVGPDQLVGPDAQFGLRDPGVLRFRPYVVASGTPVPVSEAPKAFQAGVWTSPAKLIGVDRSAGPRIVRCDFAVERCTTVVPKGDLRSGGIVLGTGR